ncbi:unnamed protein product [Clavelina lepadiformis]|uniref:Uncharacterized protein n=1 Tax=Clavelina lepadiformis TaxID=159417 RepID=A0ABP0FC38_CLALP
MYPQRSLLYHRGVDDSPGTYISDYVLFAFCAVLATYLSLLLAKSARSESKIRDVSVSTIAVIVVIISVGLGALLGGLVHQFLQKVEPYNNKTFILAPVWTEDMAWLVVWRVAATLSAFVSFAFFVLIQQLLSSEDVLRFSLAGIILYYIISCVISVGIGGYSLYVMFDRDNPWSLTVTFGLVFFCAFLEIVSALVVVCVRFKVAHDGSSTPCTELSNDIDSNPDLQPEVKNLEVSQDPGGVRRRWDLFFHFIAPSFFVIGGVVQLLLGIVAQCGKHRPNPLIHCPLPDDFNHNGLLHVINGLAIFFFFVAELLAIKHRRHNHDKRNFENVSFV